MLALVALLLSTGCFKKVTHRTHYMLRPFAKQTDGDRWLPEGTLLAYAFDADTAQWEIRSYEDALEGTLSSRTAIRRATPRC